MRAGLYLRISDDRTGREAGVTRQGEDCTDLATTLGWQIAGRYVDNDVSATSGKPRPEYRRLLDDIATRDIDAVIAWHPDRLYRKLEDLAELIAVCERHHVAIRTVKAGELDLSNPTGRMVARILGSVAEHEVEHKAERWQRSVVQNRRAGKWINARDRLYGYARDGHVDQDEAVRLRWMVEQVLAGRSLHGIATELNADGATTTRGGRWSPVTLKQLLRNPRIAGYATLNGEIVGDGTWEPVVSREQFERVGAALFPHRERPPRRAILTRLVWCANVLDDGRPCHTVMHTANRGRRGATVGQRIYRCPRLPPHNTGCGRLSIAAEPLERYVIGYAKAKLSSPAFVASVEARRDDTAAVSAIRADLDRLDARYRELEVELRSVGGRAAAAIAAAMGDVDAEAGTVRRRLAASFTPAAPDIRGDWPADIEAQNALVALTLDRVEILPNPRSGRRFNLDRIRIVAVE